MDETKASGSAEVLPAAEAEADARAAELRFVTRAVTHEEAAAVTAVILAAVDEQATQTSVTEPARNRWVQSSGALRSPITVGPGNWGRSAC